MMRVWTLHKHFNHNLVSRFRQSRNICQIFGYSFLFHLVLSASEVCFYVKWQGECGAPRWNKGSSSFCEHITKRCQ